MDRFQNIVIFGGSGFIGAHFSVHFLDNNLADKIVLADVAAPIYENLPAKVKQYADSGKIQFVKVDVRQPIADQWPADLNSQNTVDLVVNLAAVHREPGHQRHEYFDTNLPGATNVCAWAAKVNCNYIVFTSSIAVYGTEKVGPKTEATAPEPNSPYGESKLAAEKIHQEWVQAQADRKLMIVRPGVIFGTGEGGNITRMIKGIRKGYFVYLGNQNIIKSGGYVKELVRAMAWMMQRQAQNHTKQVLFNFTMNPAATMAEYGSGILKALGMHKHIWNIPYGLLLPIATIVGGIAKLFKIDQPINAARVKKLLRENNIVAQELVDAGYTYQYTLDQALADWRQEHPADWGER